jgi:hypothetical protein
LSFGFGKLKLAIHPLKRTSHAHHTIIEIDVRPPERQDLSTPQPERHRQKIERLVRVPPTASMN